MLKPDAPPEPPPQGRESRWSVWRQDDNGNQFLVCANLTRANAEALAAELESRGHKQLYWVSQDPTA
jgi:hypothetical protein